MFENSSKSYFPSWDISVSAIFSVSIPYFLSLEVSSLAIYFSRCSYSPRVICSRPMPATPPRCLRISVSLFPFLICSSMIPSIVLSISGSWRFSCMNSLYYASAFLISYCSSFEETFMLSIGSVLNLILFIFCFSNICSRYIPLAKKRFEFLLA